jgi:uncharacterized membrane protein YdjX (TVP38/TMEM64 family)
MAPRRFRVRFTALVMLIVGLTAAVVFLGPPDAHAARAAVASAGLTGPLLAVVAAAMLSAAMVPRTALAAVGGLLFGPLVGTVYVLAGASLGALLAFGIGRWLGRDFLAVRRRMAAVDRWLTTRGTLGVLTVRLLPVAPFGLVSYAFGTTGVRIRAFVAGTAVGMVPSTVVYANLGAQAQTPGTAAFAWSAAAAVTMGVAGAGTAAALGRRHAGDPGSAVVMSWLRRSLSGMIGRRPHPGRAPGR